MKRLYLLTILCALLAINAKAQEKTYAAYAVGFYNLENLFDTCHDYGKNDYQYLPDGTYKWNGLKYKHKLRNLARVIADMGTDVIPVGCAAVGVSEVENVTALTDLVSQEPLAARNFKFAHIEGPDQRGVDCALLYNPALFTVKDYKLFPYVPENEKDSLMTTRGYLVVDGEMGGDEVTIIVNHWPSRYHGTTYREAAGRQVKVIKDSILNANPQRKIIIMGDMNDDPSSKSMVEGLKCKGSVDETEPDCMYNPWMNIHKKGVGTLMYGGSWNLFDQIVMSPNLINKTGKRDLSTLKYWKCQIFRRDYLIQTEGKYKGSPKRTHAGGVWLDGYSDHLPTVVYFVKEK